MRSNDKTYLLSYNGKPYYTNNTEILRWKEEYKEWGECIPLLWGFIFIYCLLIIGLSILSYIVSNIVFWGLGVAFFALLLLEVIVLFYAYAKQGYYADYIQWFFDSEEFKFQKIRYTYLDIISQQIK